MDLVNENLPIEDLFERFLRYRGVNRVNKTEEEVNPPSSRELRRQYNLFPSSDDDEMINSESGSDSDLAVFDADNDHENIDFFRITRNDDNMDADAFYIDRRYSFQTMGNSDFESESGEEELIIDRNSEYISGNNFEDRRYSNNSKNRIKVINSELSLSKNDKFPPHSQAAYAEWEFHDSKTQSEIFSKDHDTNGGLYDPFNPNLTTIENSDPSRIVKAPPGSKFRDLINLESLGIRKLFHLESIRKYKNNLSTIIKDPQGNDYLVMGSNSEIFFFGFNSVTQIPNNKMALRFDTRPSLTSTTDRLISTWPYFPHTINFLNVYDNFLGKQILGACLDDGMLMIWFSETITAYMNKFNSRKTACPYMSHLGGGSGLEENFYGLKIKPDFKIKLEASLWGLDFLSYRDKHETQHNLIVASDNSQSVTLFYYHQQDERFYHLKTHQILHNIPEVSFLNYEILDDGTHCVKIACASISGELIVFKFRFKVNQGPVNKDEYEYFKREKTFYVDPTMEQMENREELNEEARIRWFKRIAFSRPVVVNRTLLGEDCWTSKPLNSKYFKNVQSLRAMVGDPWINEEQEIEHIINESTILDSLYDPLESSHLGLGACWQFFEAPVVSLASSSIQHQEYLFKSAKLTTVDDDYRRIHKGVLKTGQKLFSRNKFKSLNDKKYRLQLKDEEDMDFLLVSTSKRLGLFRSDTLFCNCATKRLFDLSIPFNDESKSSNRISITHVIPQILSFIAVSQQGLVSVMRMCCHRGVYGMRQEYIFPNALSLALGYHGYRTIAGLACRDVSVCSAIPIFLIYITYTDGIVITCKLSLKDDLSIDYSFL
ncbi:uncharacterized protein PRCAT00006217001 [Priceomyces carsonii]|uniref:uncharacterized protein n=1 Tax=Priceomyces carsonii TaxID=28549 RepID=UPI002ED9B788|nr:unnamed protein product [Priceomyces carsonii]